MDYSAMTDEEFFNEIDRMFGKDWTLDELRENVEIYQEFVKRTSTGV